MRPLWQGAISFGLILIPVKMYKATKERNLDFHLVREGDLCPIRYARVCKSTGEEVPYDKIAKSYKYQKGDQVIFHDEDFKKFYLKRTETIEVTEFANEAEIDMKYYERPYFLEPEKGADKVYALLREGLKKSKKVGIARYVLHNLEHLGVIKPEDDTDQANNVLIKLSDFFAFGDFDGDGINDAAAILTSSKHNEATTYSLTLNLNRYFYFQNIPDVIIGNSTEIEIKGIEIEENRISVNIISDGAEETLIYGVEDNQFVEQ